METDFLEEDYEYEDDTSVPRWQKEDEELAEEKSQTNQQSYPKTYVLDGVIVQLKETKKEQIQQAIRFTNYLDSNLHTIMHLLLEQKQIPSIKAFLNESVQKNIMQNYTLVIGEE